MVRKDDSGPLVVSQGRINVLGLIGSRRVGKNEKRKEQRLDKTTTERRKQNNGTTTKTSNK